MFKILIIVILARWVCLIVVALIVKVKHDYDEYKNETKNDDFEIVTMRGPDRV